MSDSTTVGVSFDSLQVGANGLNSVADKVTKALEVHEAAIQARGDAWGTGPVGSIIGEIYLGIHHMAVGCYEENVDVVDEYVSTLDTVAALFRVAKDATEQESKELEALVAELLPPRRQAP